MVWGVVFEWLCVIGVWVVEIDFVLFLVVVWLLYDGLWVVEWLVVIGVFVVCEFDVLYLVICEIVGGVLCFSVVDVFVVFDWLVVLCVDVVCVWDGFDVIVMLILVMIVIVDVFEVDLIVINLCFGYYMNFVNLFDLLVIVVLVGMCLIGLYVGLLFGIMFVGCVYDDVWLFDFVYVWGDGVVVVDDGWLFVVIVLVCVVVLGVVWVVVVGVYLCGELLNG